MKTPGLEEENRTKPKVTAQIEDGGDLLTAEKAAAALLRGMAQLSDLVRKKIVLLMIHNKRCPQKPVPYLGGPDHQHLPRFDERIDTLSQSFRGCCPWYNRLGAYQVLCERIGWQYGAHPSIPDFIQIGVPIWRWTANATIRAHKKEHLEHLAAAGRINTGRK